MARGKLSTFERLQRGRLSRRERKQWQRRLQSEDPGLEVVHPGRASTSATRVTLWRCRRGEIPNRCGSSDRGRRICGGWRSG